MSHFLSLILVCQHGVRIALDIGALIAMLFSEERKCLQKIVGLKKLGERV